MRIERAVNYVRALGPGRRLCVWVNGCCRHCEGCVSERLQKIDEETDVDIYTIPLYHPSGSSQCTSPKHPVSCIKPGLVIHFIYDIIHVSMPFSPSSHPSRLSQSTRFELPASCSKLPLAICFTYGKQIYGIFQH